MKRSAKRILTTHAGRLEEPLGMPEVIRKQAQAGIDIVGDGELGRTGFGLAHFGKRFSGLGSRPLKPDEKRWTGHNSGERLEFDEFYKTLNFERFLSDERVVCNGPITYIGQDEVRKDIELFKASLAEAAVPVEETFLCVVAPGWLEHFFFNEFYTKEEDYVYALADAMKHECKAIVDAGFILQLDDPALPDTYDMMVPRLTLEEYRKFAAVRVDALNHALKGLPEDRIRFHICWGSWHGPHTHDLPLQRLVDLMPNVKAGAYSVEAANPRHAHEWKVWKDVKLPKDKILIPGVVGHSSNVVEHPELVADRIIQYAKLVGRENVIAGTDCGMGLRVHPQIAWAKLKALSEGAALASKELWS